VRYHNHPHHPRYPFHTNHVFHPLCYTFDAQDNELLRKQNELLRASESAYQQEARVVSLVTSSAG
jgi:hypothetical protein